MSAIRIFNVEADQPKSLGSLEARAARQAELCA
jgi:hypothetical protein